MYKSRMYLFFLFASLLASKAYGVMGSPTVGWGPGSGLPTYSTGYASMYNPGYAYAGASYMPGYTPTSGMLTPSFSYTQQPTASSSTPSSSMSSSPLVERALQVMADWENNKDRYDSTQDFPTAYKDISDSLQDLSNAANYLTPDQKTQSSKVYWLLKFVELKVRIQEVEFIKSAIPTLLQAVLKDRNKDLVVNIDPPSGVTPPDKGPFIGLSRDWMIEKKNQLENLANQFLTSLINTTPNFWSSAVNSAELEGFSMTWKQAQQADNYLNQQLSCFNDPTQTLCRQQAVSKTPTSINLSGGGQMGGSNQLRQQQRDMYGSDDLTDYTGG